MKTDALLSQGFKENEWVPWVSCNWRWLTQPFCCISHGFYLQSIGTVGVPIKLLFEAEGMKITVEVSGVLLGSFEILLTPKAYTTFFITSRWNLVKFTEVSCWVRKILWMFRCRKLFELLRMEKLLNFPMFIFEGVVYGSSRYLNCWNTPLASKRFKRWNERWKKHKHREKVSIKYRAFEGVQLYYLWERKTCSYSSLLLTQRVFNSRWCNKEKASRLSEMRPILKWGVGNVTQN